MNLGFPAMLCMIWSQQGKLIDVSGRMSKLHQIASTLAIALILSFSASCSRDTRDSDMKQCVAEVQGDASKGALIDLQPGDNAEERHDKLGAYVAACMSKAGYGHANFEMSDARCVDDVDFNPYCYRRGR